MRLIIFCLILAVCFYSCNRSASDNPKKMDQLADRTCRAINYRKQRFALANQIRFSQDTLMQTKSNADSTRINSRLILLLKEKQAILKESLLLADTIRHQLDTLMPFTDKVAQTRFTKELNTLLKKRGCDDEGNVPSQ